MPSDKRIQTVVKWLSCIREYGPEKGIPILIKLYGKNEISIQLPDYRGPIRLRSMREDISDVSVFDKVFIQKEYEVPLANSSPKLIIDGGANIGCSSIFFANKYPGAKVYSVEPDRSNFERLVINSQAYKNIIPVHAALWNRKTSLQIKNYEYGHMALQVDEISSPEPGSVPSITISDLLVMAQCDFIDILKLDIECAEKQLFEGDCTDWLDKVETIIIELHDWITPGCAVAFYRALSRYDFRQYVVGENVVVTKSLNRS